MDKNAIKKYAVWARKELIARVTQKAEQYEITEKKMTPKEVDSINGRLLTKAEKNQRKALIEKIQADGFGQVMEEVAYTWFNRFTALRFMEVNNYLPSHTRVFTNEAGEFKPQILADAIRLELDSLDMGRVFEMKDASQTEELFKYLLITQCNALSSILPGMFQKIEDYTELLLPDYLLREGSVIERMVAWIPEEDWTDQVQIIGWLYQYYNTEPKDAVFAALKKNVKISKENIPAATQLFTPDWIVRYMVENSLGRLWLDGHPDSKEKLLPTREEQSAYAAGNRNQKDTKWHYYLEEADQEPAVQKQLEEIRKEYSALRPEEIRCIDPCMGSGHILCYIFDVLVKIYEDYGYTVREAVSSIIKNNLWGLDIDERAAQLSYFAVMMKARQHDRRFFNRKDENGDLAIPQPHVYAIVESNHLNPDSIDAFAVDNAEVKKNFDSLMGQLHDAKEYGSILHVHDIDFELLYSHLDKMKGKVGIFVAAVILELKPLIDVGYALAQQYDVVVTNPPYMAVSNASEKVQKYVKKNFPDSKADLFAVFIERCCMLTKNNGYQAMITQHAWMFLSSFEKLRVKLQTVDTVNMAHLGARAFEEIGGEVVQTTSFVIRNSYIKQYIGTYCRLVKPTTQQGKEKLFLASENIYIAKQSNFSQIPGSPVVYWVNDTLRQLFQKKTLSNYVDTRRGLQTGNSERFIRKWFEIENKKIEYSLSNTARNSHKKWFLFNSGGSFRRWYGNIIDVVNWENSGSEIKSTGKAIIPSESRYFDEVASWNKISSGKISVRYQPAGIIPGDASPFIHSVSQDHSIILYVMAVMNSKVSIEIVKILGPTLNFEVGNIAKIPIILQKNKKDVVLKIVECLIQISRTEWNLFETSWEFTRHPLVRKETTVQVSFALWEQECNERFYILKTNEEKLNRIFIDIYGIQEELTPEIEDKDVTVCKAEIGRDIRSLLSYAVGCMFGRYSIDEDGLILAGQPFSEKFAYASVPMTGTSTTGMRPMSTVKGRCYLRSSDGNLKACTFEPDEDAILPICDDEYFEDDIVGRFVEFVRVVYGAETLEENLKFIADALGGKGTSREVIRNYFINDFYKDHCRTYQKRPIYWLFDSGKKNGFKCLIYMHRYQPDTVARIRTDYVHEQQSRYRTAIADLEKRVNNAATSERVKLNKQLAALRAKATEIREYEEKIHHLADQMIKIDLDDGVKHNYEIFKDVLAKIK